MKFVSIDSSTNCSGWSVFIDGKYTKSGVINHKKTDKYEKLFSMIQSLLLEFEYGNFKDSLLVICETPVMVTGNAETQRLLSAILGSIMGYCIEHNIEFQEMRPSEWRKYIKSKDEAVPRKRKELKEWSKNKVKEMFNKEVSDDESDAILLGYAYIEKCRYS